MPQTSSRALSAATRLLCVEGVDGVSMRRVAGEVGVTPMALYRHYENKAALVDAIAEEGFDRLHAALGRRALRGAPDAKCRLLLCRYARFALDEPELYHVMFEVSRAGMRRYPEDFNQRPSQAFKLLSDLVQRGMDERLFKKGDAVEITFGIWALAHGMITLHRVGHFRAHDKLFLQVYQHTLDRHLAGLRSGLNGRV